MCSFNCFICLAGQKANCEHSPEFYAAWTETSICFVHGSGADIEVLFEDAVDHREGMVGRNCA